MVHYDRWRQTLPLRDFRIRYPWLDSRYSTNVRRFSLFSTWKWTQVAQTFLSKRHNCVVCISKELYAECLVVGEHSVYSLVSGSHLPVLVHLRSTCSSVGSQLQLCTWRWYVLLSPWCWCPYVTSFYRVARIFLSKAS